MVGTILRERLWGPTLPAGTTARASARLAACARALTRPTGAGLGSACRPPWIRILQSMCLLFQPEKSVTVNSH